MRFTIIVIILFVSLQISAQNLQTPEILSVSVDTVTGRPVVKWKVDDPSLIDGYVVKRLIYDGVGVMPDTYNNVAVIDNPLTTVWEDNSTDYSTFADPENRVEIYRVAAFVNDGTQKKYSLMSDEMSTMQIFAEYDKCRNTFDISSTYIKGVTPECYYFRTGNGGAGERFAVVTHSDSPDGLIHVDAQQFDEHFTNRTFSVEAVLSNGQSSFSPIITLVVPEIKIPDIMKVESVSVNDQNTLDITVNVSGSQDVTKTELIRRLVVGSGDDTDTLELPVSTNGKYLITDPNADVTTRYDYLIAVYGECGTPIELSYSAQNIVLEVSSDDATTNHLSWNCPPGYSAPSFTIFSIDDNGERTILDNVSLDTEYTHSLSNIIANSNHNTGKFCYQVLLSDLSSSQSDNAVEYSNIVCVDREPVLFVPNAINPDADILDNRYFRPRSGFLNNFKMSIYNKRGELLFTTTDPEQGWDGKNRSGKLYPPDAYVYVISFKTASGKTKQQSGFVNLVYNQ